uniref:Uncharacterized protein n=1 Tax=Caenorhabditis japonica TaxID=281687 RepID=A0A8R1HMW8_CAEJA
MSPSPSTLTHRIGSKKRKRNFNLDDEPGTGRPRFGIDSDMYFERALYMRKDLRKNISYKLISILNYCDVFQAVGHVFTSIFLVFPVFASRIDVFVRIVGCTTNTLWLATFPIMAILAVTRIGIAFFKLNPTKWTLWMIICLAIGFVYVLTVWIIGCITQNFELDPPSWSYDMNAPFAEFFAQFELIMPNIFLIQPDREFLVIGIIYTVLTAIVFPVYAIIIHIVGCTGNTLWIATFIIMAILAAVRIAIAFYRISHKKWTIWMKGSMIVGSVWIIFVWLAGCITQNLMLHGPNWTYDMRVPYAQMFANFELVVCIPTLALSYFSYVLIIWSIYKKKRQSRSSSSIRTEIGILVQATILTVYMTILMTLWHNADSWFEMTNLTLSLLNCVWILLSHLNAVLLIATNSGVRRQILKMMCNGKFMSRNTSRLGALTVVSSALGKQYV